MATQSLKEALRFHYNNSSVTVIALKAIDEFTIHDTKYGPIEKGREFTIPQWAAHELLTANLVQLKDPYIKVPLLQKTLWQETEDTALQSLTPDFYHRVRSSIEQLGQLNQKEPNEVRLAAQTRMEQLFRDLIANRLLKLMKISLREERLRETKKKMTGEEKWLFDRLVNLLRNWQTQVLEIEEGG
ncbi:MAG: hypothetical protein ACFE8F_00865 [Promethearchaeota archaeon]